MLELVPEINPCPPAVGPSNGPSYTDVSHEDGLGQGKTGLAAVGAEFMISHDLGSTVCRFPSQDFGPPLLI